MYKIFVRKVLLLAACIVLISACALDDTDRNGNENNQPLVNVPSRPPRTFGIRGESIEIRQGPGNKFDKVVNEKASTAFNKTQYCQVDHSVKVRILEVNGSWSKIQVVEPEWLTETHIGWIPSKNILEEITDSKPKSINLASRDFEILKTNHNSSVENFYVLIKQKEFNKESIAIFSKKFRGQNCSKDCNVYIYDSKAVLALIGKYPLKGNEYLSVADHLVSASTFDAPNVESWYPFQDWQYADYGGKNWKKEAIK